MGKLAASYFILLKGVSILRYVDDTIIFMKHDLEKAVHMNLILCVFEQLSGLKVNFYKKIYVLARLKRLRMSINTSLDARLGPSF
jgi:hypothetical protein